MKCYNTTCEHYEPMHRSGCDEHNMRSVSKCLDFESAADKKQQQLELDAEKAYYEWEKRMRETEST